MKVLTKLERADMQAMHQKLKALEGRLSHQVTASRVPCGSCGLQHWKDGQRNGRDFQRKQVLERLLATNRRLGWILEEEAKP